MYRVNPVEQLGSYVALSYTAVLRLKLPNSPEGEHSPSLRLNPWRKSPNTPLVQIVKGSAGLVGDALTMKWATCTIGQAAVNAVVVTEVGGWSRVEDFLNSRLNPKIFIGAYGI